MDNADRAVLTMVVLTAVIILFNFFGDAQTWRVFALAALCLVLIFWFNVFEGTNDDH